MDSPWVLKAEHGRLQRQDIALGLRSGGLAEVVEGLGAGDLVLPASAAHAVGARVGPLVVQPLATASPCQG